MTTDRFMARQFGNGTLRLVRGDITTACVDAIVNAANEQLLPGGGVCGAIHRAGGPSIARECHAKAPIRTGDAVATTAGKLEARHVIHAVAPIWRGGNHEEPESLASAYRRSLDIAEQSGDRTVAFPSLGTGIYGYPVDRAAPIALRAASDRLMAGCPIEEIVFYLFSDTDLNTFQSELEALI